MPDKAQVDQSIRIVEAARERLKGQLVIDLVVPVLQERGVYKTAYAPGTYRQKLFGAGDRLPEGHPAAALRWR